MNYLRGPLTRRQLAQLQPPILAADLVEDSAEAPPGKDIRLTRPVLPRGLEGAAAIRSARLLRPFMLDCI
jgi:hypothetical protein